MKTEFLAEDAWAGLPWSKGLDHVVKLADALGRREGRVGFFFRHEEDGKRYAALSSTYCMALKNSSIIAYSDKYSAPSNMVSINAGVWHDGLAYFGTPKFFESKLKQGVFLPHPAKGFKKAGNVRDFKERRYWRVYAFNEDRQWDHQCVEWGRRLFDPVYMTNTDLLNGPMEPMILCPVPMDMISGARYPLHIRKKIDHVEEYLASVKEEIHERTSQFSGLENLHIRAPYQDIVENIVNKGAYSVCGARLNMCARSNGMIKRNGPRSYILRGNDDGVAFEQEVQDPTRALIERVKEAFNLDVPIDMYPLFPEGQEVEVAAGQPLFTPLQEQSTEPEKHFSFDYLRASLHNRRFDGLCAICVLSTAVELDGNFYINAELAYGSREPIVYMSGEFSRIQRVEGRTECFKNVSPACVINMIEVSHRSTTVTKPEGQIPVVMGGVKTTVTIPAQAHQRPFQKGTPAGKRPQWRKPLSGDPKKAEAIRAEQERQSKAAISMLNKEDLHVETAKPEREKQIEAARTIPVVEDMSGR